MYEKPEPLCTDCSTIALMYYVRNVWLVVYSWLLYHTILKQKAPQQKYDMALMQSRRMLEYLTLIKYNTEVDSQVAP